MSRGVSKRAQRIWDRLISWYGAKIAEQYGKHPPDDWATLFDRTDDERLERALSAARHASPTFPPTLGQIEAGIPKREQGATKSVPMQLAEAVLQRFGSQLCAHQIRVPWNYFGDVALPSILGVQITACAECEKPSHRLKLDEVIGQGVAA